MSYDIPGSALAEGLSWNWESSDEYMDAIEDTLTGARPGRLVRGGR